MLARFFVVALSSLLLLGCSPAGPKVNLVTGKVTLDGTPIAGATVTFSPVDGSGGRPAVGKTNEKGVYTVTDTESTAIGSGAAAGEYRIGVLWYKSSGPDTSQSTGSSEVVEDKAARVKSTGPEALLPAYYSNPMTSGLTTSVKAGKNEYNITLDSKFTGVK